MSKKDEYFTMMESQIKKCDAEVDKLKAKGNVFGIALGKLFPMTGRHRLDAMGAVRNLKGGTL